MCRDRSAQLSSELWREARGSDGRAAPAEPGAGAGLGMALWGVWTEGPGVRADGWGQCRSALAPQGTQARRWLGRLEPLCPGAKPRRVLPQG